MKPGPRTIASPPVGGPKNSTKYVTYCGDAKCIGPMKCKACRMLYRRAWRANHPKKAVPA